MKLRMTALMLALVGGASRTDAAFTYTFAQVGADVVAVGTGSLNTTGLRVVSPSVSSNARSYMNASAPYIHFGIDYNVQYAFLTAYFSTLPRFGSGGFTVATLIGGDVVGFESSELDVSAGYVSGSALQNTVTFANKTFASLGLQQGTYTYAYSATQGGPTLDTITVQIGLASVPEPASVAMLGLALAGVGAAARSRRRA